MIRLLCRCAAVPAHEAYIKIYDLSNHISQELPIKTCYIRIDSSCELSASRWFNEISFNIYQKKKKFCLLLHSFLNCWVICILSINIGSLKNNYSMVQSRLGL